MRISFVKCNSPPPISLVLLTDSQPLTYQLRDTSNKTPHTNQEVKECQQILKKWDHSPQIFWHSRNTRLGRQADARTRENHLSLPENLLRLIASHWNLPHLHPFLDMYTLRKLTPFDNSLLKLSTPPWLHPRDFSAPKRLAGASQKHSGIPKSAWNPWHYRHARHAGHKKPIAPPTLPHIRPGTNEIHPLEVSSTTPTKKLPPPGNPSVKKKNFPFPKRKI